MLSDKTRKKIITTTYPMRSLHSLSILAECFEKIQKGVYDVSFLLLDTYNLKNDKDVIDLAYQNYPRYLGFKLPGHTTSAYFSVPKKYLSSVDADSEKMLYDDICDEFEHLLFTWCQKMKRLANNDLQNNFDVRVDRVSKLTNLENDIHLYNQYFTDFPGVVFMHLKSIMTYKSRSINWNIKRIREVTEKYVKNSKKFCTKNYMTGFFRDAFCRQPTSSNLRHVSRIVTNIVFYLFKNLRKTEVTLIDSYGKGYVFLYFFQLFHKTLLDTNTPSLKQLIFIPFVPMPVNLLDKAKNSSVYLSYLSRTAGFYDKLLQKRNVGRNDIDAIRASVSKLWHQCLPFMNILLAQRPRLRGVQPSKNAKLPEIISQYLLICDMTQDLIYWFHSSIL